MQDPPTLTPLGTLDKPISQLSNDEIAIKEMIDRIAASYQSILDWTLRPPLESPAEAHMSNRLRRAELTASDDLEHAKSYLNVPMKFLQDMQTVKKYDTDLYEEFLKEIENVEFDRYYGIRTEIATARSLVTKDIEFSHPDPPDFVFQYKNATLKLECTSCHIENSTNYIQKVCNTISEKASKPYSDGDCILMIDITNIIHDIVGKGGNPAFQELKQRIKSDADTFDWPFGSIVPVCYITDPADDTFRRMYIRCDTSYTNNDMSDFLDEHYEVKDESFKEFYISGEA